MPGIVSEIEEREAALFCGYTWKEWKQFDLRTREGRLERAQGVAHYRMHRLIEIHGEDAVTIESERRAQREQSRHRR